MHKATGEEDLGVKWASGKRLADLDLAGDLVLLVENTEDLQRLTLRLEEAVIKTGLRISSEKTTVMYVGATNSTTQIKVGTQPIKEVEQFIYLGSLIAKDGNAQSNSNNRIGKAAAVFRRMNKIWKASMISACRES